MTKPTEGSARPEPDSGIHRQHRALNALQPRHHVGKLRNHADQQGGLRVRFGAALFPVFKRSRVGAQVAHAKTGRDNEVARARSPRPAVKAWRGLLFALNVRSVSLPSRCDFRASKPSVNSAKISRSIFMMLIFPFG